MLRVFVLGRPSLEIDGRAAEPPSGLRARALLGWLALNPGEHSRSELAGRFWPDVLETSARASLRGALVELRRALGSAANSLTATRSSIGFERASVWVDALEFERRMANEDLAGALELCGGDLLAGLDDDWVYAAREEHRARQSDLLGLLADEAEGRGDGGEAIKLTRRQVALDSLSEGPHRELIRRLGSFGDRPAALAAYAALTDLLRRELALAPSAETRDLVDALRRGELQTAAQAPTVPSDSGAPKPAQRPKVDEGREVHTLPSPLDTRSAGYPIGRAAELAALREHRSAAETGSTRLVLLSGEAGIGKTTLAATIAREAHENRATVLYGRSEEEALTPYQPWVESINRFVESAPLERVKREIGPTAAELQRLVPALSRRFPDLPDLLRAEPDTERYRLFEAMGTTFAAMSEQDLVVILLDDLHWADKPTLLLLLHLVRSLPALRLLMVATYRDTEVETSHPLADLVANLRREGLLHNVSLRGLDEDHVGELVARARGKSGDRDFVHALHGETEGNPFFVEEVLRGLPDLTTDGTTRVGATPGDKRVARELPEGVKEAVGRRLRRLSARAREVLALASVIGRDFDLELLQEIGDESEDHLIALLEEATDAAAISEIPGEVGQYTFTHALIRATLYDGLSRTRRARVHLRLGEALSRSPSRATTRAYSELAHHFIEARRVDRIGEAVDYSMEAAKAATRQSAYEEAAAYLRKALAALDAAGVTHREQRVSLWHEIGEAEARGGDVVAARGAFEHAYALARDGQDAPAMARAALGFAGPPWRSFGEVDRDAIRLLEGGIAALEPRQDALAAKVLARLAIALYFDGDAARVGELTERAVAIARRLGDLGALAASLDARLYASWTPDGAEARLTAATELLAIAEEAQLVELAVQARRLRVVPRLELAQTAQAALEVADHARQAEDLRQPYELMYTRVFGSMQALMAGRFDEARRLSEEMMLFGGERAGADAVQFTGVHTLMLLREREGLEALIGPIRTFIDQYPAIPAWRAALAYAYSDAGRQSEALAELDALAVDGFSTLPRDANWLPAIGWLAFVAGDWHSRHANELYELLLPYERRNIVLGAGGAVLAPVAHPLGGLAATLGDRLRAGRHFEIALSLTRHGADALRARIAFDMGRVLLGGGASEDRARATELLSDAGEVAERLGMTRLLEGLAGVGAVGPSVHA